MRQEIITFWYKGIYELEIVIFYEEVDEFGSSYVVINDINIISVNGNDNFSKDIGYLIESLLLDCCYRELQEHLLFKLGYNIKEVL